MGNLTEGGHLEDLGVQGKIILKWVSINRFINSWLGYAVAQLVEALR